MKKSTAAASILFVAAIFVLASNMPVQAMNGLQVSPAKIELELSPEETHESILHIHNDQDSVSSFSVYLEDETFRDWISFDNIRFSLQPDEIRPVKVTIRPPGTASGDYEGKICILCHNDSQDTAVATGVNVPVKISVPGTDLKGQSENGEASFGLRLFTYIIAALAVIGLALIFFFVYRRRRDKSSGE